MSEETTNCVLTQPGHRSPTQESLSRLPKTPISGRFTSRRSGTVRLRDCGCQPKCAHEFTTHDEEFVEFVAEKTMFQRGQIFKLEIEYKGSLLIYVEHLDRLVWLLGLPSDRDGEFLDVFDSTDLLQDELRNTSLLTCILPPEWPVLSKNEVEEYKFKTRNPLSDWLQKLFSKRDKTTYESIDWAGPFSSLGPNQQPCCEIEGDN